MSRKLIDMKAACRLTSLSRTAINKFRAEGHFPRPVQLSEKRIAFVEAEVEEWIDQRIAARTGGAA